jgi:Domain of Unknown Function (DUF326)
MSASPTFEPNQQMQQCIQNCLDCHRICSETITYCLQLGGAHAEVKHISLLLDCADICQTSANFMIRGSEMHRRICGVCSDICDRCAADCERMGIDDVQLKTCAEICRRCAESCRQMAKAAVT